MKYGVILQNGPRQWSIEIYACNLDYYGTKVFRSEAAMRKWIDDNDEWLII